MTISELKRNFETFYKIKPRYYIDTGGRYEIVGNHTDHNHGCCLVANSSLRIRCVLCKNSKKVKVKSKGYKFFKFDIDDLSFKKDECFTPLSLCKGVLFKLKEEGYNIGGFNLYLESDLPDGSGVSSSAAIESLYAYIISYLYNDGKIPQIVIAKTGQFSENNYFNKQCGLLDQVGTSFDGVNFIDFKNINKPKIESFKFDLPLVLYLIKSKGNHSNLSKLYDAIPASMKKAAKLLDKKEFLRDVTIKNPESLIDNLKLTNDEKLKAKHFFIENKNVLHAKKYVENGDIEGFLNCVRVSQNSSKENLKNTFVEGEYKNSMQEIIDITNEYIGDNGAIRIHGGGFKGTCLCFIKKSFEKKFDLFLKEKLGKFVSYKVDVSSKAVNFKKI